MNVIEVRILGTRRATCVRARAPRVLAAAAAFAAVCAPGLRSADAETRGCFELVGGVAIPQGDRNYESTFGPSAQFGVRAGGMRRFPEYEGLSIGLEVGVDHTELGDTGTGALAYAWERRRAAAGMRIGYDVVEGVEAFGRAAAGVDHLSRRNRWGYSEAEQDDLGIGVQFGLGALVGRRAMAVGAEIGLTTATHDRLLYGSGFRSTEVDVRLVLHVRL